MLFLWCCCEFEAKDDTECGGQHTGKSSNKNADSLGEVKASQGCWKAPKRDLELKKQSGIFVEVFSDVTTTPVDSYENRGRPVLDSLENYTSAQLLGIQREGMNSTSTKCGNVPRTFCLRNSVLRLFCLLIKIWIGIQMKKWLRGKFPGVYLLRSDPQYIRSWRTTELA